MTVLYSSCSTKFKNHWLEDGKGKLQTIIFERAETSPNTMFHDLTFIFKYCQKEIQQKDQGALGPRLFGLILCHWLLISSLLPSLLLPLSISPQLSQTQVMHTLKLWVFFIFTKMQISEKDLFAFWNWSIDSVQFSHSVVSNSATPWIAACQASLSITNSWSSPKLMCIKSVMPSSHLILCHPLLLLPPIPPSIRVFPNESTLRMRWPKYVEFQL